MRMPGEQMEIGVVTDEVSRSLQEALDVCAGWGISRFELREGSQARFPNFTAQEIGLMEERIGQGDRVTAVSPGILKGHVQDTASVRDELEKTLPRALELCTRFRCPVLIVFGFEQAAGGSGEERTKVLKAFERVAQAADDASITVAVENEPGFWIDRPRETAAMLQEIGHPRLMANWDPANSHWGGYLPDREDFLALRPFITNVHVKDHAPGNSNLPWRPVGQGDTPWREYLPWIVRETNLSHVTLETHCQPLLENSRESIAWLRRALRTIEGSP